MSPQSQTPLSKATIDGHLEDMAGCEFTTLKHNFLRILSTPAGDLFDNWDVPIANFAHLAASMRDAGCFEGIVYDGEEYLGDAFAYPANTVGKTLSEARAQAVLRGQQIMEAMVAEWPDIVVISAHGPTVSEYLTPTMLGAASYGDWAAGNPLKSSVFFGFVKASVGTAATVVDGGEIYTLRSKADFETAKAWQQEGMAESSFLMPDELRDDWTNLVQSAFGVYDETISGKTMDVDIWATTLANALEVTDRYVWAYTEAADWTGVGWPVTPVTQEWIDSTVIGRGDHVNKLTLNQRLGGDALGDTTGFAAEGAGTTLSYDTAQKHRGEGSIKAVTTAATGRGVQVTLADNTLEEGTVTFSAWARASNAGTYYFSLLSDWDGEVFGVNVSLEADVWIKIIQPEEAIASTAAAHGCQLKLATNSATATSIWMDDIDASQITIA